MKKASFCSVVIIGLILTSLNAYSDILFFDLNYSVNEVEAIRKIAQVRNEKLLLFPDRSHVDEAQLEKQWRLVNELERQRSNCLNNGQKDCSDLDKKFRQAKDLMNQLTASIKKIDPSELERIISSLGSNSNISLVAFSGHSGLGGFTGLFGGLDFASTKAAFDKNPEALKKTTTILLLGCYSGTLNVLYNLWQKTFPSVKLFAGYEKRSPLGIRPESARFLTNMIQAESRLLNASSLAQAHAVFKSIGLVAELDGTALLKDYFLSYAESGSIQDMLSRCGQFPEDLYKIYQCYDKGEPGCENPPVNHQGPLREFYSFLQINSHCSDLLKEKYPDIPTKDYLIRLIYLDNIKSNFRDHYRNEINIFSKILSEVNLPQNYSVENYLNQSRAQNIALDKSFQDDLLSLGMSDGSFSVAPNADKLEILQFSQSLLKSALNMSEYRQLSEPCTPFSWVDLGATEKDRCAFGNFLLDPLTGPAKSVIEGMLYTVRIVFEAWRISPLTIFIELDYGKTKAELKKNVLNYLLKKKKFLQSKENILPSFSQDLLKQLPSIIIEVETMTEDQLAQNMIQNLDVLLKFSLDLRATIDLNNKYALDNVDNYILAIKSSAEKLRTLR